jgi:hypothetical protein
MIHVAPMLHGGPNDSRWPECFMLQHICTYKYPAPKQNPTLKSATHPLNPNPSQTQRLTFYNKVLLLPPSLRNIKPTTTLSQLPTEVMPQPFTRQQLNLMAYLAMILILAAPVVEGNTIGNSHVLRTECSQVGNGGLSCTTTGGSPSSFLLSTTALIMSAAMTTAFLLL